MTMFVRWRDLIWTDDQLGLTVGVVIIASVLIALSWVWNSAGSSESQLDSFPSLFGIFIRALIGSIIKSRTFPPDLNEIPFLQVCLTKSTCIDQRRLEKFQSLVGDEITANIPIMFFIVESFRLCLHLLTHPLFPVSTIGAVLTKHASKVLIPCTLNTKLNFRCQLGPEITRTDKGHVQIDVVNEAFTEDNRLAWKSTTTVIIVNRASRKKPREARDTPNEDISGENLGALELSADIGRRYGLLNGDLNPIHLWQWTAWIFGFRRPIAHALYLTALSFSWIQKMKNFENVKSINAEFKRPTLLPAKLLVLYHGEQEVTKDEHTTLHSFCLASEDRKKKVLVGQMNIA